MQDIDWNDPQPTPTSGDTVIVNVADVRLKATKNSKGWNTEIAVTDRATKAMVDAALMQLDYARQQMEQRGY